MTLVHIHYSSKICLLFERKYTKIDDERTKSLPSSIYCAVQYFVSIKLDSFNFPVLNFGMYLLEC